MADGQDHKPRRRDFEKLAFFPEQEVEALLAALPEPARAAFAEKFVRNHPIFKLERATFDFVDDQGQTRTLPNFFNFERGDSVAVLPFDRKREIVVLVEQVRSPILEKHPTGWLTETVAGMPRPDADSGAIETDVQCALRELKEETGIELPDDRTTLFPRDPVDPSKALVSFFPSAGGSSERVKLFLADITDVEDRGNLHAINWDDFEYARVRRVKFDEFFENVRNGEYQDAKILAAADLLERNLTKRVSARDPAEERLEPIYAPFVGPDGRTRRLALLPGDVTEANSRFGLSIDVWVNSEDPTLQMNRLIARSFSGAVRSYGAVWADQKDRGRLLDDTIAHALARAKGATSPDLGQVFSTCSGALLRSHGVRRLFHVVATRLDDVTRAPEAVVEQTEEFTRNALAEIDAESARAWRMRLRALSWRARPYRSAALTLFGTGTAGADVVDVVARMIPAVVDYWADAGAKSALEDVYLCCFDSRAYRAARRKLDAQRSAEPEASRRVGEIRPIEEVSPADRGK